MTNKFQITSLLRGQSSRMNKEPQATTNQISSTKKKPPVKKASCNEFNKALEYV